MKKLNILLLLIPLLTFNCQTNDSILIGKWIGEDKTKVGFIEFDKTGYVTLEIEGQIFGGERYTIRDEIGSLTYVIHKNTNPIEIDLIHTNLEDTTEQRIIPCLAKLTDMNTLKFAGLGSLKTKRPSDFKGKHVFTLTKKE